MKKTKYCRRVVSDFVEIYDDDGEKKYLSVSKSQDSANNDALKIEYFCQSLIFTEKEHIKLFVDMLNSVYSESFGE